MTSHTSIKLAKPDKILNDYLLRSFAPTKNTIEPPPAPTFPPRSIEPTVQNKPEPPSKRQKGALMNEITRIITLCRCGKCIYCEFGGNPPAQIIEKETVCGDCERKDKLIEQQRAEIEQLALEIENKQYTITCASEENQQLKESLAEARAEIERLKQLWSCNLDIIGGELNKQLSEARAEIDRLKAITDMQRVRLEKRDEQLTEARAEIEKQDALLGKCLGLLKQQKERGES